MGSFFSCPVETFYMLLMSRLVYIAMLQRRVFYNVSFNSLIVIIFVFSICLISNKSLSPVTRKSPDFNLQNSKEDAHQGADDIKKGIRKVIKGGNSQNSGLGRPTGIPGYQD